MIIERLDIFLRAFESELQELTDEVTVGYEAGELDARVRRRIEERMGETIDILTNSVRKVEEIQAMLLDAELSNVDELDEDGMTYDREPELNPDR